MNKRTWTHLSWDEIQTLIDIINTQTASIGCVTDNWGKIIHEWYDKHPVGRTLYNFFKIFSTATEGDMLNGLSIPYNKLPLHINDRDRAGLRAVAIWRLQIGK